MAQQSLCNSNPTKTHWHRSETRQGSSFVYPDIKRFTAYCVTQAVKAWRQGQLRLANGYLGNAERQVAETNADCQALGLVCLDGVCCAKVIRHWQHRLQTVGSCER